VRLWLKYRGVPSPWEFVRQPRRLGFKCRKYAGWQAVHVDKTTGDVLRRVGDTLLDQETLPLELYGHVSRVWERVQRWAKDKDKLALEPDQYESFETFSRTVRIGAAEPLMVDGVLADAFGDLSGIEVQQRWGIFILLEIAKLLGGSKDVPDDLRIGWDEVDVSELTAAVSSVLTKLYDALGFELDVVDTLEKCKFFLRELELPQEPVNEVRPAKAKPTALPTVVVEQCNRSDNRIAEVRHVGGTLVVKVNSVHVAMLADNPAREFACSDFVWKCIGRACLDHLGKIDDIQDFLDSLGQHIASETRVSKRDARAHE
jgi:hypothetical protein